MAKQLVLVLAPGERLGVVSFTHLQCSARSWYLCACSPFSMFNNYIRRGDPGARTGVDACKFRIVEISGQRTSGEKEWDVCGKGDMAGKGHHGRNEGRERKGL